MSEIKDNNVSHSTFWNKFIIPEQCTHSTNSFHLSAEIMATWFVFAFNHTQDHTHTHTHMADLPMIRVSREPFNRYDFQSTTLTLNPKVVWKEIQQTYID